MILKTYLILVFLSLIYLLINDRLWFRWIYYSLFCRKHLRILRNNLKGLNENERLLAIIEWIDTEYWFKKYWFGKKANKIILEELEKLK